MTKHITQLLPVKPLADRDSVAIANGADSLQKLKTEIFYLDGREIRDKQSFLQKVAEVMRFPDYFGYNWDALEECITDLDWCPAARYILIYDYPEVFSKAEPEEWKIANDILRSAVEYWQGKDTPLEVLLIGESVTEKPL
ncbi:barstar family protein [Pseudanabaena sp. BC1403]|uniref:barstar family protein n=1 Tax=Pseudanabaena sp. BC1403 TaxID=2043171 RepID=UPI000CD81C25|nr:barstar family protein [Pseudanabaena sp. BC1403]